MASLQHDLDSFTAFARRQIQAGVAATSIDDLYDQWREQHGAPEDAMAIAASLRDMEHGEKGRDFEVFVRAFAERNQLGEQP
jgi:hypothetical protein